MAKYRITLDDGTTREVTAPDNVSQDDVLKHADKYYDAKEEDRPGILNTLRNAIDPTNFAKGALQGAVLDPIEGVGQLAEEYAAPIPLPHGMREWFSKFADDAGSTWSGSAGNVFGTLASFLYGGGELGSLARAAKIAERTRESARAGKSGLEAVSSVLGPERAGPVGYEAVRRATKSAGEYGKEAVKAEVEKPGAGKMMWTQPQDFERRGGMPPFRPSRAAAAKVGTEIAGGEAPTFAERFALGAKDFPIDHPAMTMAGLGGLAAATRPVDHPKDSDDFWKQKAEQVGLGALAPAALRNKTTQNAINWAVGKGLVFAPAAGAAYGAHKIGMPYWMLPFLAGGTYYGHHGLGRMANQASKKLMRSGVAGSAKKAASQAGTGVGALTGKAVGEQESKDGDND